ncbi:1323_t:CDS:10 [Ambispora leptoticha]|uniref:1323_t:CDS:1 n=1 Tax=Ambispora leptoticha TaxID=144679 RepID=A0A9N8YKS2_9GLOM|nr:1323_t:CDS:10 [Ambispora leptoticha]
MGATDSKLAFRKGVFRLFEERNIPASDEYWSQFWLLPESADDVFSLVGASDIRRVRDHARENLETLIYKVIDRLFRIVRAPDFPSSQNSTSQLLNYLQTQLLFNINAKDSSERSTINKKLKSIEMRTEAKETEPQLSSPLGERLLSMIIDLLFLSGFTLPTNIATETRVNYVIWETGVGSTIPIGSTKEYDLNKTETLRLLLVLLSKSMYLSGGKFMAKESKCLKFLALKSERKVVLALLCSLLNTAVKYNPAGWGVPYNYMVFADARETLVTLCLQVLLVLLDYRAPANRVNTDPITGEVPKRVASIETTNNEAPFHPLSPTSSSPLETPTPRTRNSHQQDDASNAGFSVSNGWHLSYFEQSYASEFIMVDHANNTYLPGSAKPIRCHPEMLMLCWKLLEINKRFRTYLLETDRVLDVLIVLLYYALENKQDLAQSGLVRMCAFILQTISADRNFGVKLNKTFEGHSSLPSNVRIAAFHGTYADFMIISIYALISTTRGTLHSLYPALILTIANVSPYLKNLSVVTSTKLVQLFVSFSTPGFLLSEEGNHRLTGYMLEAFNNIIQYQFSDNPHVIYAIVRTHKKFEDLAEFTLAKGLLEIKRIQAAKEERRKQARGSTKQVVESDTKSLSSSTPSSPLSQDAGTTKPSSRSDSINSRQHGSNATHHSDEHDEFNEKAELMHSSIHSDDSHGGGDHNHNENDNDEGSGHLSEKARGKLPEGVSPADRRQSGDSSRSQNIIVPPFAVGKSGFVPTEDWVSSWHSNLPLGTIIILLSELVPQVQSLCGAQSHSSEQEVLEFLRSVTLVGILPQPQAVSPHHFLWSEASVVWFSSLLWGQIYLAGSNLGVFNGTQVKLFLIKTTIKEDRIKNALGTAVGGVQGVIGRITTATHTPPATDASSNSISNTNGPANNPTVNPTAS